MAYLTPPIAEESWARKSLSEHPRVVIINGPAGVGKTTTSRAAAGLVASGACIHGDDLKNFVVCRTDAVATGLGYSGGARIASTFIEGGYDLVVFDYVFEHPDGLRVFMDSYSGEAPVHLFTLWADLDTVLVREAQRHHLRAPLGDRVRACHAAMESQLDHLGELIRTEDRHYVDIARDVIEQACEGVGLISSCEEYSQAA